MNPRRNGLLALLVIGIPHAVSGASGPEPQRTGNFAIAMTPGELLGAAAEQVASVATADEQMVWETYVPEAYSAESPAGVLVYVSPSSSGKPPHGWARVMEEHNLIWIGANESGNRVSTSRRVLKAILALEAVRQQYAIDDARIYIAGFSGGGRVASMIATEFAGTFVGGIFICGAEFWDVEEPRFIDAIRSNRYVFLSGENDQALGPTMRVFRGYRDAGVPNIKLVVVNNMGHSNPPRNEISEAIEFLDAGDTPR